MEKAFINSLIAGGLTYGALNYFSMSDAQFSEFLSTVQAQETVSAYQYWSLLNRTYGSALDDISGMVGDYADYLPYVLPVMVGGATGAATLISARFF